MTMNPRAAFFDAIAEKWDGWEDLAVLERRLAAGLEELGLGDEENVVDVGCGTGNLTRAVLAKLSPEGHVFAVDLSPRMIEVAKRKVSDPRASWHLGDARRLLLPAATCDRVICYSVWPHLEDRVVVAAELRRVLKPGGSLHVWHLASRQRINDIHAGAGEAVRHDLLPPAEETAGLLAAAGFRIAVARESASDYLVTAEKPRE
jgi:ubiquinone/menaquinone biosynthesis C-methylase UbiE